MTRVIRGAFVLRTLSDPGRACCSLSFRIDSFLPGKDAVRCVALPVLAAAGQASVWLVAAHRVLAS